MNLMEALRCPRCGQRALQLRNASAPNGEPLPESGEAACGACSARYPIRAGVLDMQPQPARAQLSIAGLSNQAPLAPLFYERVWRPRSLGLLTHGKLSTQTELRMLGAWTQPQPKQLIVDLGSSTDLYARALARAGQHWGPSAPEIVALDLAPNMLRAGRSYARREGIRGIAHVRAPAQALPFADGTVDVIVCGGSLNEFRSMGEAFTEASRVLAEYGVLFSMSLSAAHSTAGALAQRGAGLGGIRFPSPAEFNALAQAAGLRVTRQENVGVVLFSLMEKLPAAGAAAQSMELRAAPAVVGAAV